MAILLNFVVKTALISCYKFALVLQKNCAPFSANQNWVIFSRLLLVRQIMQIVY